MQIIYLSNGCSEEKFSELRDKGITRQLPQAQKYNRLLMEGLANWTEQELVSISAYSVNRQWTKQVVFSREEEHRENIHYIYGAFWNLPIFRQLTRIVNTSREIKKLHRKNPDMILICDVLNQSLSEAARMCGKKYGIPVVGIVTDVPGLMLGTRNGRQPLLTRLASQYAERRCRKNLGKYDGYLLLTEAMNSVVNTNHKPYLVIEGHADSKMAEVSNTLAEKQQPKVALYAGGIHKEYGIGCMVEAFRKGNFPGWQLHIYGDGNYRTELEQVAAQDGRIRYFGAQPNALVVQRQLEASVLINPRLTNEEYVKYSFPSKTMECMASGTPLLTTKLPGMPKEYAPYVYFITEETESGMQAAMEAVFAQTAEALHQKGAQAKDFVMREKNNIHQAKKLMDFLVQLKK